MNRPRRIFQWQIGSSQPVMAGDVTVTPQSQALIVRWSNGGLVWNRPAAVVVERSGQVQRILVYDITRIMQWSLITLSAICWIGTLLFWQQTRKYNK